MDLKEHASRLSALPCFEFFTFLLLTAQSQHREAQWNQATGSVKPRSVAEPLQGPHSFLHAFTSSADLFLMMSNLKSLSMEQWLWCGSHALSRMNPHGPIGSPCHWNPICFFVVRHTRLHGCKTVSAFSGTQSWGHGLLPPHLREGKNIVQVEKLC